MNSINELILIKGRKFLHLRSYSCWSSVNNFRGIYNFEPQIRCIKTTVKAVDDDIKSKFFASVKRKKLFSKTLTEDFIMDLSSVTAISVEFNCVSWSTVLLPSFYLANWNCINLFERNSKEILETKLLKVAFETIEKLPMSDLYIMENLTLKPDQFASGHFLKFLLIMYLSTLHNDSLENSKLLFQKPSVLNSLRNLTVGGERVSSKHIIINSLIDVEDSKKCDSDDPLFLLKIEKEMLNNFSKNSEIKQESLSIALLLNMSFLNIAYLHNSKALALTTKSKAAKKIKEEMDSEEI